MWGVEHRYGVLLEPHAPHFPLQPPIWGGRSLTAKWRTYRQRAYVWMASSEFGLQMLIGLADMSANNFVEMIRFFTTLILNADESREI